MDRPRLVARLVAALISALASSVVLAGCGDDGGDAGTIALYSGRGEQFVAPIVADFEETSDLEVETLASGSSELLHRILHEGDATPCDAYITNDSATLEEARRRGVLAPLPGELLERVEPRFRAGDGSWVAVSLRIRVVVINTAEVPPDAIDSVFDLADPRWKGKVGRTAVTNESFVSGIAAMIADHGEARTREFLRGLDANTSGSGVYKKHTPIVEAVAEGRLALGYVNHYYYYRHRATDPGAPIDIVFPDQGEGQKGAAWNVSGAAVLTAAPHSTGAREFVGYLLSPAGQTIFAMQNFEYPVVADAPTHPDVRPRASVRLSETGIEDLGRLRRRAVELVQEVGL